MTGAVGEHTERHSGKAAKREDVSIRFSAYMTGVFRQLAESVRNDRQYNQELLPSLELLASGKPMPVITALASLGTTTEETIKYIQKSGNSKTRKLLNDVLGELEAGAISPHGPEKLVIQVRDSSKGR